MRYTEEKIPRTSVWTALGLGISLFCVLYLFFVFKHSAGYNDRTTLFFRVRSFWNHGDGTWTHGMFVVPLLAVLLYLRRKDFSGLPLSPSNWGFSVLGLACFLYWVGYKANVHYFGFAAVHLFLIGVVLSLLGWKWFQKLFFYIAFLAFMWPIIFLDEQLAVPLRYLMVSWSSGLLNLLGVENLRVGTAIVSVADAAAGAVQGEQFQLDVANPCSGIRSLFALMMVTALYALSMLSGFWKRLALFAFSLPLAILGNLARILMLAFGSIWFGTDFAIGDENGDSLYHMISGFVVFIVALMGMAFIASVLKSGWLGVFGKQVSVVNKRTVSDAEEGPRR